MALPKLRDKAIESQTIAFPMQDLVCCPCLANKDEYLVLSQVTIEILTDESLKSTELFPHVHWLHTQEVVKVCMQLTYFELISRKIYLCKKRLLVFFLMFIVAK